MWISSRFRILGIMALAAFVMVPSVSSQAGGPGAQCDDDIVLFQDQGCSSPCCTQSPANSGHYVFAHQSVENVDIRANSNVLSVSFPNLQSVENRLRITYNYTGAIASISLPSLFTAGAIDISNNPSLVGLDLPHLSSIVNNEWEAFLRVQGNDSLTTLNVPRLDRVIASEAGSAYVQVRYNPLLPAVEFPLLRSIEAWEDYAEAYLFIADNESVGHITMNDLRRLAGGSQSISYVVVFDLPQLTEMSFSQLTEILPAGGEYDFSELTVGDAPNLGDFVFPSLERVTVLQLIGLKSSHRAMFPRLSDLDYLWLFRNCQDEQSSLKIFLCNAEPIMDTLFGNNEGLCGPSGYMLSSPNAENQAACDASSVCQSFVPEPTECQCNAVGLCLP